VFAASAAPNSTAIPNSAASASATASAATAAPQVGGAALFSLYIVYDVSMISKRTSPDDYISAAIELYLDIANLFLHILCILAHFQENR
jgi:FtsH-binding integral membrane protein